MERIVCLGTLSIVLGVKHPQNGKSFSSSRNDHVHIFRLFVDHHKTVTKGENDMN